MWKSENPVPPSCIINAPREVHGISQGPNMPSFSHKIDEWMKEAETRPESAVTIVRLVAKRLNELAVRNEELLTENIALQNGTRVEEYQKRIAHLEYQLDLLKRRFGGDESLLAELPTTSMEASTLSL